MAILQAKSGSGTANSITETIVGSQLFKIEGFSATKDLGVGKSLRSSTFSVGGHGWYIECYPCGVDDESFGLVTLFLCLSSVHVEQVEAKCCFVTLLEGDYYYLAHHKHTYNAETSWRRGVDVLERGEVQPFLKQDCFQIICDVYIVREFVPAVPQPYLLPSGMPGVPTFQVHRALQAQDPSAHVAAFPISTKNVSGSHVLTIQGYSNMKKQLFDWPGSGYLGTEWFQVGGQRWQIELYPSGYEIGAANCLAVFIKVNYPHEALKARVELTLLNLAREKMAYTQFCQSFSRTNHICCCYLPIHMEPQSSHQLWDSFHVKCDITVVKEITPIRLPDLHLHFANLLASQVGTDVEFEVGGDLFSAHKCVLATRSTAFMADFFGPAGNGSSRSTITRVRINDMEPRVFRALLHFIYTDTVPEVPEDDKAGIAHGLLVAADRFDMERLKLICSEMLCNYMLNDPHMAVDTVELAVKHGCHRLKEKCKELVKLHLAKVAP